MDAEINKGDNNGDRTISEIINIKTCFFINLMLYVTFIGSRGIFHPVPARRGGAYSRRDADITGTILSYKYFILR